MNTKTTKSVQPLVLTVSYYSSFIVLGLATAVEGPSLPTLARHTSSSLDAISLIFVLGAFGYLLGSFFGGYAYDKFPGHRLMAFALLVMATAAVTFPLVSILWLLLLAAFTIGIGKGTLDVGCNTLLQWVHGAKVGPFMNGLHFCFGLGSFLSPILLAQVISITYEIYWAFWTIALLTIPLAIWFWFLPEPSAHLRTENQDHLPIPFVPVVLIVLAFLLYVGLETGFSNWIYTYATTLNLATVVTAAYLTSAFWGFFTVGRLLGVWVATRFRSRTILFMDLAGCVVAMGLILIGRASAPLLWIGSAILGLSMASIFPTILILAGESMRVTGTVTGWFLVGAGTGGMLLPWTIGQAFTAFGPHSMMPILVADLAFELFVLLIFIFGRRVTIPSY